MNNWQTANKEHLVALLKWLQEELLSYQAEPGEKQQQEVRQAKGHVEKTSKELQAPSAIDTLVSRFGLTTFERNVLLLCAGVELDHRMATTIAALQGDASSIHPSFSLALAALAGSHWNAISPSAPLRYWRMIRIGNDHQGLLRSPLKIDESILHFLCGIPCLDEKLEGLVEEVSDQDELTAPSQQELIRSMANSLLQFKSDTVPLVQLCNGDIDDTIRLAAALAAELGLNLYSMESSAIPVNRKETAELARIWNREAALNSRALLIRCRHHDSNDKPRTQLFISFIESIQGVLLLDTQDWTPMTHRRRLEFDIRRPSGEEQLELWKKNLGATALQLNGLLDRVVSQFNMSASAIDKAASAAVAGADEDGKYTVAQKIWTSCCVHTRPKVDALAERIEAVATWNDIVLPEAQKQVLREITAQVKHRAKVYGEWGFRERSSRGLGISALFAGESGTGKTMAAEVLANELKLDLYRIDLSQVVNKYIGETEKNLKQIFDAAEAGGALLLFDEADALFGKRSDVKDSHDRYSNIEVSYLLQKMEAYNGLAVLTTNMKTSVDSAFLRRIRFVVQFPYPDVLLRAEIWKRVFPAGTPVKDLDIERLAKLNVAGGNIRNIALNAAFIAADEGQPVQMTHIAKAAKSEYGKMERSLSSVETAGW